MNTYVLRVAGYNGRGEDPTGMFVVSCDVDAHDGLGQATLTEHELEAKQFPDPRTAMAYWRRQSSVKPFRDDGRPNRPLTAYTVECFARVVEMPAAEGGGRQVDDAVYHRLMHESIERAKRLGLGASLGAAAAEHAARYPDCDRSTAGNL